MSEVSKMSAIKKKKEEPLDVSPLAQRCLAAIKEEQPREGLKNKDKPKT